MSYAAYQRIKLAAMRDAYLHARQLGLSAEEATADGATVGAFVTGFAESLGATAGVVRIAIDDHHTVSLMELPSHLDPAFFASRFYLRSQDDRAPNFVAVSFVGHDRGRAVDKLRDVAERIMATNAADQDWGA